MECIGVFFTFQHFRAFDDLTERDIWCSGSIFPPFISRPWSANTECTRSVFEIPRSTNLHDRLQSRRTFGKVAVPLGVRGFLLHVYSS